MLFRSDLLHSELFKNWVVSCSDAILALLMASPRSVYSWDITIEKTNGILFLDKRENSLFDFLTVSETAREPPQASEDIDEINHPEKLSIEATMINQNFSQQVLKEKDATSRKTVINIHYWSNSTICPHCLIYTFCSRVLISSNNIFHYHY